MGVKMGRYFLICLIGLQLMFLPQPAFSDDGKLVFTALIFGKIIGFALVYFLGALFTIGIAWLAICFMASGVLLIADRVCAWRAPLIVKVPILIVLGPILLGSYLLILMRDKGLPTNPAIDKSRMEKSKKKKKKGPIFGSHFVEVVLLDEQYHAGGRAVVRKLLNWTRPY